MRISIYVATAVGALVLLAAAARLRPAEPQLGAATKRGMDAPRRRAAAAPGEDAPRRAEARSRSLATPPVPTRREEPARQQLASHLPSIQTEVAGVILDALGGPVRGARVSARSALGNPPSTTAGWRERTRPSLPPFAPAAAFSGRSGEFRLRLPTGRWSFLVEADGYASVERELDSPSGHVRVHLSPEAVISGRVVDETTRDALPGVTVIATKSDRPPYSQRSAVSDASGGFELRRLSAGTHQLRARSPELHSERVDVEVAPTDTASGIELMVERATTVSGAVRAGGRKAMCRRHARACRAGFEALGGRWRRERPRSRSSARYLRRARGLSFGPAVARETRRGGSPRSPHLGPRSRAHGGGVGRDGHRVAHGRRGSHLDSYTASSVPSPSPTVAARFSELLRERRAGSVSM